MKTRPLLLTTVMIVFTACTTFAQDGKYKIPPSKDVIPSNPQSPPLNITNNREKFLQRLAKQNNNPAYMRGKDSFDFDINEIRKNPALFKALVLEHRKDLTPFTRPNAVAGSQLESASITGSGFHLTKDINALSGSYPSNNNDDHKTPPSFAVTNNVIYFAADDGIHGSELWRSDGTTAGTYMVKDIEPGSMGSEPNQIIAANGKVYFSAYTTADQSKPWVSDGTDSGTIVLFKTTFPPNPEGYPHDFVSLGNAVYFIAASDRLDHIWKTDGTQAGTVQIDSKFYINQLTAAGDHLFYTHYPDRLGFEIQLNSVDSNGNSTLLISNAGDPTQFTNYNNKLYFSIDDGTGRKLWMSDGTVAGTKPAPNNHNVIITPNDNYNAPPFPVMDSVLYVTGSAATNTTALYKYDAYNNKGLIKVKDLGAGNTIIQTEMAAVNNKLYFKVSNNNGIPHNELWSTNGSAAGTQPIQRFEPEDDIYNLYNGDGILYFVKKGKLFGTELWRVVNTTLGVFTKMVKDIYTHETSSYPYFLTACNGKLYFSATDDKKGNELFVTNGNPVSTVLVKDINTITTSSNAGHDMIPFRNGVLFNAYDNAYGDELYKSDGTAGGTDLLNDVRQGELSSSPFSFLTKNNAVYFIANTSDSTNAIYKTDGTKKGLQKITPDYPKYPFYYETIKKFDVADNGIVYYAKVDNGSDQLWRSDGTAQGTFMLYDDLYFDAELAVIGNTAFFVAYDAAHGAELWKSNGSVAGTRIVKDIYPGIGDGRPLGFYVYKNELYFGANDGTDDGLWKSDGTKAGTVKLKNNIELLKDYYSDSYQHFCISKDMLYFIASDQGNGYGVGLWKTNGTSAGTRLVKTLQPYVSSGETNYLTDVNGTIFFINENSEFNMELWKSDGTPKGTQAVTDFTPYPSHWYGFDNFTSHAGKLYFTNDDVLWSSDGTEAGTTPVNDHVISKVQVYNLASAGNKLFASGYTSKYGTELYEATIDSTTATITMTKVASAKAVNTTTSFGAILYPNPASSVATLQLTGSTQNTTVTITNISGVQLWQRSNIHATSINLPVEQLAAGTYMVTVTNGKESKTIKLVVSHR